MMQKSKLIMWKSKDEFSIRDPHSKTHTATIKFHTVHMERYRMSVKDSHSKLHGATVNMGVVEPT